MALTIILGRGNTGKSKYIYESILNDEICQKNIILFVPQMARIVAEKEYLHFMNKKSITNTRITTLERYISENVNKKELYNNKKYLPELAKKMYIKRALEKRPELFDIFKKVKDTSGFIETLCSYFDIFEKENISKEIIEEIYQKKDFTHLKLKELINIYNSIKEDLKLKFVDSIDEMDYYINQTLNNTNCNLENIIHRKIYFDLYNNFSKYEFAYIKMLLSLKIDVTISLNLDFKLIGEKRQIGSGIFDESLNTYNKLRAISNELNVKVFEIVLKKENKDIKGNKEDLEHLKNNIFEIHRSMFRKETKNVEIYIASNLYEEIRYVARSIYEKTAKGEFRYKDIAIATNNMADYEISLKKIFNEYNIPFFLSRASSIKNTTIVTYLLTILDLAINGFNYSDNSKLFTLLKTGLFDLKTNNVCKLENYVAEFGIKGYMFNKDFYIAKESNKEKFYNIDSLNETRKQVVNILLDLSSKLNQTSSSKDLIQVIYNHLQDNMIVDKYTKEIAETKKENLEIAKKKEQVILAIYDTLDCISLVDENISSQELLELLKFGIDTQSVATIPTMLDQIEIFDLNKNRIMPKKTIYIIGVNEGGIPKTYNRDSIFSNLEIEKIKNENIELKKTSIDRLNMELFNIYLTINKCKENLVLTVPSSKMTGENLRLSPLIQDIKNVLPVKLKSNVLNDLNEDDKKQIIAISDKYKILLENITKACDTKEKINKEIYTEYSFFKEDEKYNKVFKYVRKDKNLKEEILNKIYSGDINLSVSRLENLRNCPFAYYLKYILQLKENKQYKLSTLDMGSIMHEVLEKVSRFLISKNILWQEIHNEESKKQAIKVTLSEIIDEIFEKNYPKYALSIRHDLVKLKLKKSMMSILLIISESFNQSAFVPLGYEIEFDTGKLFAPIEIILDSGKKVYLRGKIDRVDMANIKGNTYLRVIDYKSSAKKITIDDIKEGMSLQLMTYMSALVENGDKISNLKTIPAALNYFTLNTSLINLPEYEKSPEILKEKVVKMLKLKGIYLKDVEVLKELDTKAENIKDSYIDVNLSKLENNKKYLSEEIFDLECKNIKKILKQISEEILKGKVKIRPCNIKNCDYCEYFSICRKTILA